MPNSTVVSSRGFRRFALHGTLERNLRTAGYHEPRTVQDLTIPAAQEGRDVLGLAQTGTGKTAAFALPILDRLLRSGRRPGPRVLVVAPTRELAIQIDGEFRRLAASTGIRTVVLHGGVPDRPQIRALRANPDVIVACPGRLLDLHGRREAPLDRIETLVLDEADHMFDMGFLPDIRRILGALPAKRQNMLFGATMPPEIRRLASKILRDPHVTELNHSAPARTIDHAVHYVVETRKQALLERLLGEDDFVSAIVFTRTKHRARRLAQRLERDGRRAIALQGNMSQGQRDRAMGGFREGRYDVLVATDLAARGLDVEQVSHVINYDVPRTPEAYTHRIGRTGRSERHGQAFTLVTAEDRPLLRAIEKSIGHAIRVDRLEDYGRLRPVTPKETSARPAHGADGPVKGRTRGRPGRRPARRRR